MIQFFAVIFIFFLSWGISANAWGQPQVDAMESLKMMAVKAQMSTSYNHYAAELTTTKAKVDLFLKSPEAQNKGKLAEAMKKALGHYEFARLVWQRAKIRQETESGLSKIKHYAGWNPIKKRKEKKESLKEKKEEEERLRLLGKSVYYLDKVKDSDILQSMSARYLDKFIITKEEIHVDELLPIIWKQASHEVKNAAAVFQKQTQIAKETDGEDIIEESSLIADYSPVRRPRRRRQPRKREASQPPVAPLPAKRDSLEQSPVSAPVMRMVNPAIHDID